MKQRVNRWTAGLLAILMVGLTAGLTACSEKDRDSSNPSSSQTEIEPPFADLGKSTVLMKVDGQEVTAEQYIPYLYSNFNEQYYQSGLYMLESLGGTAWAEEWEIEGKTYDLAAYIHYLAQKEVISRRAVEIMMEQYQITLSPEEEEELRADVDRFSDEQIKQYGFTRQAYESMLRHNYNGQALFYSLYDEGGAYAVPEEEVYRFFRENFLTYKAIELDLTDDDGNELQGLAREAVMNRLERYLELYRQSGDFDKLIAYAGTENPGSYENFSYELPEGGNRVDIVFTLHKEENPAETIKDMAFGEVRIAEYDGKAALLLRLDPEADREDGYYESCRATALYHAKFEEHNRNLVDVMNTLSVEMFEEEIAKFDPHEFANELL